MIHTAWFTTIENIFAPLTIGLREVWEVLSEEEEEEETQGTRAPSRLVGRPAASYSLEDNPN